MFGHRRPRGEIPVSLCTWHSDCCAALRCERQRLSDLGGKAAALSAQLEYILKAAVADSKLIPEPQISSRHKRRRLSQRKRRRRRGKRRESSPSSVAQMGAIRRRGQNISQRSDVNDNCYFQLWHNSQSAPI